MEKKGKPRGKPPLKWGEPTTLLTVRVPISRKVEVRDMVQKYLNKFKVKTPKKKVQK
jgi:hypothetical protein